MDLGDVLALVPFLCALLVLIPALMPQRGKTSSLASKYFRAKSSVLILAVVAVILVGIGVAYLVPSTVVPGHPFHGTAHHTRKGLAVIGLAILTLFTAWFVTPAEPQRGDFAFAPKDKSP